MSRTAARACAGRDRTSLYQEITNKIIAELEAGRVPWVGAIASGTYDIGVETITAESLVVTDHRALYTHPKSGAFTDGMVERLRAIGLISEIISWKLRLFVPTGAFGPAILAKVMDRYPLVRLAEKVAA